MLPVTVKIKLILSMCANIMRTSERYAVLKMLFSWDEKDAR